MSDEPVRPTTPEGPPQTHDEREAKLISEIAYLSGRLGHAQAMLNASACLFAETVRRLEESREELKALRARAASPPPPPPEPPPVRKWVD